MLAGRRRAAREHRARRTLLQTPIAAPALAAEPSLPGACCSPYFASVIVPVGAAVSPTG